jgi:hypothetical protein
MFLHKYKGESFLFTGFRELCAVIAGPQRPNFVIPLKISLPGKYFPDHRLSDPLRVQSAIENKIKTLNKIK